MPHAPLPRRVRFGRFELDAVNADLRKDGRRIRLRPQALTLLALLVDRAGTLVLREELRLALWPEDTFVDFDHGLNATIAEVRRVLGDAAGRGRLIETVPRRGYRFVAPVEVVDVSQLRRRQSDQTPTPDTALARIAGPMDTPLPMAATRPDEGAAGQPGATAAAPPQGRRIRRLVALAAAAACLLLAVQSMADYLPWRNAPADPAVPVSGRRGGTSNPVAWQAYSRARVHWANRTDCTRAVDDYRAAAQADPAFALPWVGIADCYTINAERRESQAALAEAERRAPGLGETHAARGLARMFLSWDWRGAHESFEAAMRLAPEYASAYQWAGLLALFRGNPAEARRLMDRAAALDPTSPTIAADRAWVSLAEGRPQDALAECNRGRRMAPAHNFVANCFVAPWIRLGQRDEEYASHYGAPPPAGADVDVLLRTHYEMQLKRVLVGKPLVFYMAAKHTARLGRGQEALMHLTTAVAAQEFLVPFAVVEPAFDNLRAEPTFRALMDKAGLGTITVPGARVGP